MNQVSFRKEHADAIVPTRITGRLYCWAMPPEEVVFVATQANAAGAFHIPPTHYDNLMYVVGVFQWWAVMMGKPADRALMKHYGNYVVYNDFLKARALCILSS